LKVDKRSRDKSGHRCPYCSEGWGSFEELKAHILAEHGTSPLPRPEGVIALSINGEPYEVRVEPQWTLHHLIHDVLGLIGTKTFCDRGTCGSCSVILEGRVVLSCMTLAVECDGKSVETIEGIAAANHPLIDAYVKHHAMQCGYCTPGFIVAAKALLDRNPDPSEEEVKQALAGNLCRCGTYPQHPKAVLEAAGLLKSGKEG